MGALLVVAALVVAGCGGGSSRAADPASQAKQAVQRYIDALEAKDAKAACAAMSIQGQRATGGTGKTCETNISEAIAVGQAEFKGARAVSAKVTGSNAIVQVSLPNGSTTSFPAVRENGTWKYAATAL